MTRDPHDAAQDARSDALYEHDPSAEPEQWEVDARRDEPAYVCVVDESAGFRG